MYFLRVALSREYVSDFTCGFVPSPTTTIHMVHTSQIGGPRALGVVQGGDRRRNTIRGLEPRESWRDTRGEAGRPSHSTAGVAEAHAEVAERSSLAANDGWCVEVDDSG